MTTNLTTYHSRHSGDNLIWFQWWWLRNWFLKKLSQQQTALTNGIKIRLVKRKNNAQFCNRIARYFALSELVVFWKHVSQPKFDLILAKWLITQTHFTLMPINQQLLLRAGWPFTYPVIATSKNCKSYQLISISLTSLDHAFYHEIPARWRC